MGQGPFFADHNLIDDASNVFSADITTGIDNLRNLAPDLRARSDLVATWNIYVDWGGDDVDISGVLTYGIELPISAPGVSYILWDGLYPTLGSQVAQLPSSPVKTVTRYPNLDPYDTSKLWHDGEFIQHVHAFTTVTPEGLLAPQSYTCKTLEIRIQTSGISAKALGYIGAYDLRELSNVDRIGYDNSVTVNYPGSSSTSSQGAVASSANSSIKSFDYTVEYAVHTSMQAFRSMVDRVGTDLPFFFLRLPSEDPNKQRYDRVTEGGLVRLKKPTNRFPMNRPNNTQESTYKFSVELTPWR